MDRYEAEWHMVEPGWKTHVLRRRPPVRQRARGRRDLPRRNARHRRSEPARLRRCAARTASPSGPSTTATAVIFFNFRGDRAIEITQAFEQATFDKFDRGPRPERRLRRHDAVRRRPQAPEPVFGVAAAHHRVPAASTWPSNGVTQLAISETQKYGHVTYFWNGNRSGKFDDESETYIEIPSDTLPVRRAAVDEGRGDHRSPIARARERQVPVGAPELRERRHGRSHRPPRRRHPGGRGGGSRARPADALRRERSKGILVVTADHGNADEMYGRKKDGSIELGDSGKPKPKTGHTLNAVPFAIYAPTLKGWRSIRASPNRVSATSPRPPSTCSASSRPPTTCPLCSRWRSANLSGCPHPPPGIIPLRGSRSASKRVSSEVPRPLLHGLQRAARGEVERVCNGLQNGGPPASIWLRMC